MLEVDDGVPVSDVIEAVKRAIKAANLSSTDIDRDLRVSSFELTLNTVATRSVGGSLDFRVPFIGMQVKLGTKLTTSDTHKVHISLIPPDLGSQPELRDNGIDLALVEAIGTVRAAVASAAAGDDPFVMTKSSINILFAITAEGVISLGLDGGFADEITHDLTLALSPVEDSPR